MLVNFKLGTSTDYTSNSGNYSNYIYACSDTRDVYFFGILQQGISDELWGKIGTNPENFITQIINNLKGQPDGIASLDENGKIPISQLNGQLARVQGVDAVATSSTLPSEDVVNEYMVYTTDNKKFNEYSTETTQWTTIDPQGDTIYNFRNSDATGSPSRTNILYRWDGEDLVEISASIALGETAGTAYEGNKGKENRDALNSLPEKLLYLTNNQGTVTEHNFQFSFDTYTKNLGNNQYTKDGSGLLLNIPVLDEGSTAQEGLMTKADLDYLKSLGIVVLSQEETTALKTNSTTLEDDLYNKLNAEGVKAVMLTELSEDSQTTAHYFMSYGKNSGTGEIYLAHDANHTEGNFIRVSDLTITISSAKQVTLGGSELTLENSGDGSKALFNDGTYKNVSVAENTINAIKVGNNVDNLAPVEGIVTIGNATTEADGAMSKEDKASLENLNGLGIVYINDTEYQEITSNLGSTAISEDLYNKFTDPNAKIVIVKDPTKGYKLFTLSTGKDTSSIILRGTDVNSIEQYNTDQNITYYYESYSIDAEKIPYRVSASISFQTQGEGAKYLNDQGEYTEINATQVSLSEAYAPSELENGELEPAAGDTMETATSKLHKAILDNEEVVSNAMNAIKKAVGLTDNVTIPSDKNSTNYMQNSNSIWEALKALDTKIKELENALTLQTVS